MLVSSRTGSHLMSVLLVTGLTVAVAAPHFFGGATLIGDSDRLNTFLSMKVGEVISIQETGRVPAWNENSFMGFNMRGLYWMLPGANPDAYVHALLPIAQMIHNAGFVTFGLLLLALLMAYAFLFDLAGRAIPAVVGACTYGYSALSIGRLAQVDSAYLTLVVIPLGMLALRRTKESDWRLWFSVLVAGVSVMLGLAFLQEAAYALLLFGAYALYLSIRDRSKLPLLVLIGAVAVGILLSAPRIIMVAEEFRLMFRTTQPSFTDPTEILRFLHDGMFGRYWQEAWETIGNRGLNVHEGVQTYSSTIAACLILGSPLLVNMRKHAVPLFALLTVLVLVVYQMRPLLGLLVAIAAVVVCVRELRHGQERFSLPEEQPAELGFHLFLIALVLAFILLPAFRAMLYHLFLRVDFLHSRATIAALLSLASAITLLLAGLLPPPQHLGEMSQKRVMLLLAGAALTGAITILAVHYGVEWWENDLNNAQRRLNWGHLNLSRAIFARTLLFAAIVLTAIFLIRRSRSDQWLRRLTLCVTLGVMVITECVLYAHFRLFGEHTQTYPIAFKAWNYFTAPTGVFSPPDRECRDHLREKLQNQDFRSVIVADEKRFPAFVAPHLAQFWQVRLVDGYPGLPISLAELPWPHNVVNLRSIAFRSADELPWFLLSILNVKRAIVLNEALYYNTAQVSAGNSRCGALDGITILENPFPVVPRHYFVANIRVESDGQTKRLRPVEGLSARAVAADRVELTWWPLIRDGDIEIEALREGDQRFVTVGRFSPLRESSHIVAGLVPGAQYTFRARKLDKNDAPGFITDPVKIRLPYGGTKAPKLVRAVQSSEEEIELEWDFAPEFVTMNVEMRSEVGDVFHIVTTVPQGRNSARIKTDRRTPVRAVRVQAVLQDSVSPHSEERWVGSKNYISDDLVRKAYPFDPLKTALVEGIDANRSFRTGGVIRASYGGDIASFDFDPAPEERFLVINELFHPRWHAYVDGQERKIYLTNKVMRGVLIPPNARELVLSFTPFVATLSGMSIALLGVLAFAGIIFTRVRNARPTTTS